MPPNPDAPIPRHDPTSDEVDPLRLASLVDDLVTLVDHGDLTATSAERGHLVGSRDTLRLLYKK